MQEKDLKNISIDNTEEVYTLSTLEGEEKEYRKILEFTNPTMVTYTIFSLKKKQSTKRKLASSQWYVLKMVRIVLDLNQLKQMKNMI